MPSHDIAAPGGALHERRPRRRPGCPDAGAPTLSSRQRADATEEATVSPPPRPRQPHEGGASACGVGLHPATVPERGRPEPSSSPQAHELAVPSVRLAGAAGRPAARATCEVAALPVGPVVAGLTAQSRAGGRRRHTRDVSATPPPSVTAPWSGGDVTARAHCVLAPNPGPMTLDGTNTWVLLEPGSTEAVVVDPGPLDEAAPRGRARRRWRPAGPGSPLTVLTHGHHDHAEAAPRFAELTGATGAGGRVRATTTSATATCCASGGLELRVVATPGPHLRLDLVRAARRPRAAHRRHGARPGHHGRRPPRRRARGIPRLARADPRASPATAR